MFFELSYRQGYFLRRLWMSAIFCGIRLCYAQQIPMPGIQLLDPARIFPAFGVWEDKTVVSGLYKSQMTSIDGGPVAKDIYLRTSLPRFKSAIAMHLDDHSSGLESTQGVSLQYARAWTSTKFGLSLGLKAGWKRFVFDGASARTPEGNYTAGIDHQDPEVPLSEVSDNAFETGLSIFVRTSFLDFGLGMDHIRGGKFVEDSKIYRVKNILNFAIMKEWNMGNIGIVPYFILYSDFIQFQEEILCRIRFGKNIFGELFARGINRELFGFWGGTIGLAPTGNWQIFYRYETEIHQFGKKISGPGQEIGLRFDLPVIWGKGSGRGFIYNPRWSD